MDWLKGFDLSLWWNQLIAVGVAMLIAALAAHERGLIFIGMGLIACGFGESRNHKKLLQWTEPNAYRPQGLLTSYPRVVELLGVALVGLGVLLIAFGLYRLLAD